MNQTQFSKQDYILLAKLAQQTQRYEQMINYADILFMNEGELTHQQRNLCSSAYKNVVGNKRAQLRVLTTMRQNINTKQNQALLGVIDKYQQNITKQLHNYCKRILKIIDDEILSKHHIKSVEAKVFYLKLKGDFYRYLCQFTSSQGSQARLYDQYLQIATKSYNQADTLAQSNLPQTNPVRLSLHLNMSVFLYERLGQTQKAIDLANRAFDQAISNIDTVNEENYKDCTMILQLMRDNISLWGGDAD